MKYIKTVILLFAIISGTMVHAMHQNYDDTAHHGDCNGLVAIFEIAAQWLHNNIVFNFEQIAPHRPHIVHIGREIRHHHNILNMNMHNLVLPATMIYIIQRSYNPYLL